MREIYYRRSEDIFIDNSIGSDADFVKNALNNIDEIGFDCFLSDIQDLVDKKSPIALYYASQFIRSTESDIDFDKRKLGQLHLSAEKGYVPAIHELAIHYDVGDIVSQDTVKAAKLFKDAAEAGHPHAQWIHGLDLLYGRNGVQLNERLGVSYIRQSAEAKFEGALESVASFYETGKHGFPINIDKARCLRKQLEDENVLRY